MKKNDTNTVAINLGTAKKHNLDFVFHRDPGDHSADSSSKERPHEKPGEEEGHPHLRLISEEKEAEGLYQEHEFGQDAADAKKKDFERTFELDYFDTPFTDNTLLPDRHRLAMTLKDINVGKDGQLKARVKIIEFPQYYVLSGHRPAMDQLNKMMERTRE
jgi:hypothetical protein